MRRITNFENIVNTLSLSQHDIELKKAQKLERFRQWALQKGIQDTSTDPDKKTAVCPCCGHLFFLPSEKGGAE